MAFGLRRFEVDESECAPRGGGAEAPQRQRRAFGLGALAGGSVALALVLCLRGGARVPGGGGGGGAEKFAGLAVGPPGLSGGGRSAPVAARRSGPPVTMSGGGSLTPGEATELDAASLAREIGDPGAPLLIDLFATWCGPCKMIEPFVGELARKAGSKLRAARLDWEASGARQLLQELATEDCPTIQLSSPEVTGYPTVVLVRDGRCVASLAGAPATARELEEAVAKATGIQL